MGSWLTWLILAGRGWGKTRTGAEYVADLARRYPGCRIALVAATFADGRDTMVEGESGLLAVLDDTELLGGNQDKAWNRSMGELKLANGSQFKIYSSEKPRQLRGPQHHFAWCDEVAAWQDAHKGATRDSTWSNLVFGMRLKALPDWPAGYRTRIVASTTPRNVALLKESEVVVAADQRRAGIMQRPSTVVTRGRTLDNLSNLSDEFKAEVIDPIAGTSLARQELDGELIEDTDGALLSRAVIERCRISIGEALDPILSGVRVVSVDPAVTTGEDSDETGISVLAHGYDGRIYVLADHSLKGTPEEWAYSVWAAVCVYRANAVVVETNQGGQMVENTLRTTWHSFAQTWAHSPERASASLTWNGDVTGLVDRRGKASDRARISALLNPAARFGLVMPPIHGVHPSVSKWVRAQPTRLLYEQGRIRHVNHEDEPTHFMRLEDQLTSWTGARGEKSPDRIDALVHGVDFLMHPAERASSRYRYAIGRGRPRTAARAR